MAASNGKLFGWFFSSSVGWLIVYKPSKRNLMKVESWVTGNFVSLEGTRFDGVRCTPNYQSSCDTPFLGFSIFDCGARLTIQHRTFGNYRENRKQFRFSRRANNHVPLSEINGCCWATSVSQLEGELQISTKENDSRLVPPVARPVRFWRKGNSLRIDGTQRGEPLPCGAPRLNCMWGLSVLREAWHSRRNSQHAIR